LRIAGPWPRARRQSSLAGSPPPSCDIRPATIKGFEVKRALRKGRAAIFNLTRDIRGRPALSSALLQLAPAFSPRLCNSSRAMELEAA
jgi:hypothetical protein